MAWPQPRGLLHCSATPLGVNPIRTPPSHPALAQQSRLHRVRAHLWLSSSDVEVSRQAYGGRPPAAPKPRWRAAGDSGADRGALEDGDGDAPGSTPSGSARNLAHRGVRPHHPYRSGVVSVARDGHRNGIRSDKGRRVPDVGFHARAVREDRWRRRARNRSERAIRGSNRF
jgi:hypothetical protein